MNEIIEKDKIENMIYEIRGVQVMTAYDLANLYHCKNGTKEINQAVKNNPKKFPQRYSWILSDDDVDNFLVKNFDQKKETRGGKFKDVNIFKQAKKELIIVDSYADNTLLDIIRKIKCKVILITKNSDRLSEPEIDKFNRQYNNLKVIRNNDFHDRYFIIDKKEIYQSGTSINNAGDKIFSINKLEDKFIKEDNKKTVNDIINSYLL